MLLEDLTDALGDVDVQATVSGLDVSVEVDLGDVAFDASGLLGLVGELAPPELAAALDAVRDVVGSLETGIAFDPGELVEELRGRLEAVTGLADVRLDDLADAAPPTLGWDGLQARLDGVLGAFGSGALGDLAGVAGGLVPRLDLGGVLGALSPTATGVLALVQVMGALLTYEHVSAEVAREAGRVRLAVRGDASSAAGSRLARLAADAALATAIRAADPTLGDDLDVLGRRVVAFLDAVHEVADLWTSSLAYAEAAAIGVDVDAAAVQLTAAGHLLATADLGATARVAAEARSLLDGVTGAPLPDPFGSVDQALDQGLELMGRLRSAVDGVDAEALVAPVGDVLSAALQPLRSATEALEELGTAVTAALQTLRQLVESVDLSPVTAQIRAAFQPVQVVLDSVTDTVGRAEAAIDEVVARIQGVLEAVRAVVGGAAATVRAALADVEDALSVVDFAAVQATLEAGIGQVTHALGAARLDPYFDAAGDAIDTTADVVDAVPFGLLPTDLQQEIVDAVRPIKEIDVEGIATGLRGELAAITGALDTEVLAELDAAYQAVLAFLVDLDPCVPVAEFEAGPFTDLREAVASVDPRTLLAPVEEALAGLAGLLTGVDLARDLLGPLDQAFAGVRTRLEELDPRTLLAPAVSQVDDVRDAVADTLHLDLWDAQLDRLRDGLAGLLARLDPAGVAALLDGAVLERLEAEPATTPGFVATALAGMAQSSGLDASAASLVEVLRWCGAVDGAAVVRGRLAAAADDLGAAAAATRGLDPAPLLTAVRAQHRRLLDAVRSHGADTPLRLALEPTLVGVDVDRVFARLLANHDRARGRVAAVAGVAATLTASARGEVTVATDGLVDALRPVTSLADWVRALLARFGISDPAAPLESLLRTVWAAVGPGRILPQVAELATALRDLALEVLDALVAPLRSSLTDVRGVVDLLDLAPVVELTAAVHDQVGDAIDAFDPVRLLGPVVADAQALVDRLETFDPLAPVRATIDALDDTIETTFETMRPTVLFADACDIHALLVEAAAGLDVRALLDPVLSALDDLRVQLDEGLEATAAALVRLQAALPGEVSDTSVTGSVSVEIGL